LIPFIDNIPSAETLKWERGEGSVPETPHHIVCGKLLDGNGNIFHAGVDFAIGKIPEARKSYARNSRNTNNNDPSNKNKVLPVFSYQGYPSFYAPANALQPVMSAHYGTLPYPTL
jgi:hypothetical protein